MHPGYMNNRQWLVAPVRREVRDLLNRRLADTLYLKLPPERTHWRMKGLDLLSLRKHSALRALGRRNRLDDDLN